MSDAELLTDISLRDSVNHCGIELSRRIAEPVPVATLDGQTVCSEEMILW